LSHHHLFLKAGKLYLLWQQRVFLRTFSPIFESHSRYFLGHVARFRGTNLDSSLGQGDRSLRNLRIYLITEVFSCVSGSNLLEDMVCSSLSVSPQYSLGQGGRFFSVILNLLEDEEGGLLCTELQNSGGNSYCSLCAIFEYCVKDVRFLNANFDTSGAQLYVIAKSR
jgi:hypothetical protein